MVGQAAIAGELVAVIVVVAATAAAVALQLRKRAALEAARAFFHDRHCVLCDAPIPRPAITARPPALRAPDGRTIEWTELSPTQLRDAVVTHLPVCWNCHVAEAFRQRFPERVTDRPRHSSPVH